MNNELFDFMSDLRAAESTDDAGQSFISFAQKAGASVVHTFFGTHPEKQSVSTLPPYCPEAEGRKALVEKNHVVEPIRAGVPRLIWGIDFDRLMQNRTATGVASVIGRFDNFRQRSSVTFSMPDADNRFTGAGVGVGFEDKGSQFLKRMDESGGTLAVASFAAYSQMLKLAESIQEKSRLSNRQAEILTLLATGKKLSDIADTLKISDSAVNLYLANLRKKLNVRTKEQALAMAISKGWIKP